MAKIEDIEIPSLLFDEQDDAPTTPASGFWRAYFKSDGLYIVDDAGTETGPLAVAGVGGGGITSAYVGKTAVGASTQTVTASTAYFKKITITTACILTDIEVYASYSTDFARDIQFALYDDDAGVPDHVIATSPATSVDLAESGAPVSDARWFSGAFGRPLVIGSYWLAVLQTNGPNLVLRYDTGGSDVSIPMTGQLFVDAKHFTNTDTTRDYSIRGNTIR